MASLDESVCNIVEIYKKYANAEGKLKKGDLKRMMENEIKNPALKARICSDSCEKVMGCADQDKDGEVTCDEFKKFVGHMMKCCYEHKMGCRGCDQ